MITIEYCADGSPVSDFNYKEFVLHVKSVLKNKYYAFRVSTQIGVDAIRLEVARGNIPHDKIQFEYKDELMTINKCGILSHYPAGFCRASMDIVFEIIKIGIEARKAEKDGSD